MERLTRKGMTPIEAIQSDKDIATLCKVYNKLSKLEDIEEELDIDLLTLFKALKCGIWIKNKSKIEEVKVGGDEHLVLDCNNSIDKKCNYWLIIYQDITGGTIFDRWVSDYGKTWALTKEELEK